MGPVRIFDSSFIGQLVSFLRREFILADLSDIITALDFMTLRDRS